MKAVTWLLALTLALSPCVAAKDNRPFWQRVFLPPPKPSRKASVKPKMVKRPPRPKPTPTSPPKPTPVEQRNSNGYFVVDAQWYANYLEYEVLWNYWITDDAFITFKEGKYHVPPTVYRHLEDMAKAPKPSPIPISL